MAYKLPLNRMCDRKRCGYRATFTVHNHWNEKVGIFCGKHADEEVKRRSASEKACFPKERTP